MNKLNFAYLAGIIDADGFISAHKARKMKDERIYCAPLIGISGTNSEPHELARSLWGGSLFTYRPKNPNHQIQHMWQAVGRAAFVAMKDIRPFIRVKLPQLALATQMWEMIEAGMHRTDPKLLEIGIELSRINLRTTPRKRASITLKVTN